MGEATEEGDIPKRATTLSLAGVDLDRTGSVALYRQIYDELRGAILSGRMAGGGRLPSTRGLAAELGVARLTVLEAFDQLYADGYVEGPQRLRHLRRPRASFRCLARRPIGARRRASPPAPGRLLSRRGAILAATPMPIPTITRPRAFVPGIPASTTSRSACGGGSWPSNGDALPSTGCSTATRPATGRCARRSPPTWARRAPCAAGRSRSRRHRHAAGARPDRPRLLDPGDAVWVEDPGYSPARGSLSRRRRRLVPVPVDERRPGRRRRHRRRPARAPGLRHAVAPVPARRDDEPAAPAGAAGVGRRADAWVLEDDYDSEYRYAGRPLAALQGLDGDGRVIYVGTLQQGAVPRRCASATWSCRPTWSTPSSRRGCWSTATRRSLRAGGAADFIAEGHFARHIRRMRGLYAERQAALVERRRASWPA